MTTQFPKTILETAVRDTSWVNSPFESTMHKQCFERVITFDRDLTQKELDQLEVEVANAVPNGSDKLMLVKSTAHSCFRFVIYMNS